MPRLRTAPSGPPTITTNVYDWLKSNAPGLGLALDNIPKPPSLLASAQLYSWGLWSHTPSGEKKLDGWMIFSDGVARVSLIGRSIDDSWGFLFQPAFKFEDLSSSRETSKDEFTFLLACGAFTAYRDPGGRVLDCTLVPAIDNVSKGA